MTPARAAVARSTSGAVETPDPFCAGRSEALVLRTVIHVDTVDSMKTPSHSSAAKAANLMVRLDPKSKRLLQRVAALKGVSTSDYVRSVVVTSARRDLLENEGHVLSLTAPEQVAFWQALAGPASLTPRQMRLAELMRGKG